MKKRHKFKSGPEGDFLNEYQKEAASYDKTIRSGALHISVMGLCGEIGEVISIYKKRFRDRAEYPKFKEELREELGDALWYLASICSHLDIKLKNVARDNLKRTKSAPKPYQCDSFSEYQALVFAANKRKKNRTGHTQAISGLTKNAANLYKLYAETDKKDHISKKFKSGITKNVGDTLWYLMNICSLYGFQSSIVAYENLSKIRNRADKGKITEFDKTFDRDERFPRKFSITFLEKKIGEQTYIRLFIKDMAVGDYLTDNAYSEDYYRYHDVFHLSYLAILGWSPVIRSILKLKRKTDPKKDEVDDGARAIVIEEAISAFIFSHAENERYFEEREKIDSSILQIIKQLVNGLEVRECTQRQWEKAILDGYAVFRKLLKNKEGIVSLDLNRAQISYRKLNKK